ncbi:hypothetical protein [Microvirga solisilvae]|uniref:hypothetical protein n=1 Tax=Microvirga solisilvae TaxID=2919498 RepID=UPI001FAF027A|nr:hypothetical protein [Microvirga solisilvae]
MIASHKPVADRATAAVIHALGEVRDAVRELRRSSPESILISLAEQKIDKLERAYRPHQDRERRS